MGVGTIGRKTTKGRNSRVMNSALSAALKEKGGCRSGCNLAMESPPSRSPEWDGRGPNQSDFASFHNQPSTHRVPTPYSQCYLASYCPYTRHHEKGSGEALATPLKLKFRTAARREFYCRGCHRSGNTNSRCGIPLDGNGEEIDEETRAHRSCLRGQERIGRSGGLPYLNLTFILPSKRPPDASHSLRCRNFRSIVVCRVS